MSTFRVYIIKCLKTDKCYVSYTSSEKDTYDPVRYLNSIYEKDNSKYTLLGESIKEHGIKDHKFTFVKEKITKDEASEITNTLREKLIDRSLNIEKPKHNYFENELALLY